MADDDLLWRRRAICIPPCAFDSGGGSRDGGLPSARLRWISYDYRGPLGHTQDVQVLAVELITNRLIVNDRIGRRAQQACRLRQGRDPVACIMQCLLALLCNALQELRLRMVNDELILVSLASIHFQYCFTSLLLLAPIKC